MRMYKTLMQPQVRRLKDKKSGGMQPYAVLIHHQESV